MPNITTIQLVGVGGTAPYSFSAPSGDPQTTLTMGTYAIVASSGSAVFDTLQITSDTLAPGNYTVRVILNDSNGGSASKLIGVTVNDPASFVILNESQEFEPTSYPSVATIPLLSNGQSGTVTWSLLPNVTSLPSATIDSNNNLVFIMSGLGSWSVGLQATDSVSNVVYKVIQIQAVSAQAYQLVDGQLQIKINAPATKVGFQNFTVSVSDAAQTTISTPFTYKVNTPVSSVELEAAVFDHEWAAGDTTSLILPIAGDLSGYSLGSVAPVTLSNGLTVTVDGTDSVVKVSGPPSNFQNVEFPISLVILQGGNAAATVTRTYTLVSHDTATGETFTCNTLPYIVGNQVALNPVKPYFNSPSIFKASNVTVRVKSGSSLPLGLSLDANTGLIYGTVLDSTITASTLEYVDNQGTIQGVVTIAWDIKKNTFSLTPNITVGQLQQVYAGTITTNSISPLTAVTIYRGRVPAGMSATINTVANSVVFSGAPTEAGYFDIWFQVTNQLGQSSFIYSRLIIDYINPLTIMTTSLPSATSGLPYSVVLRGFGGVGQYTWSTPTALPNSSWSLNSAGLLSGTATSADSNYDSQIVVNLTDSRSVTVSASLELKVDDTLKIVTSALPNIIPGEAYGSGWGMQAQGGVAPYTWSISGTALPSGINFSAVTPLFGTGTFSGRVNTTGINQSVTITVKDSAGNQVSQPFTLQTGAASGMLIDPSGVGMIDRGAPYQGLLRVTGTFIAPITWPQPALLPTGLTLTPTDSSGITATISGSCTRVLNAVSVLITAIDSVGNSAQANAILQSMSSLAVAATPLPQGTTTASYNYQLTTASTAYNPPLVWTLDSTSPAIPYSLSTSGLLSGSTPLAYNQNIVVRVTDNLGNVSPDNVADTAVGTLNLVVQNSTLAIPSFT